MAGARSSTPSTSVFSSVWHNNMVEHAKVVDLFLDKGVDVRKCDFKKRIVYLLLRSNP